MLLRIALSFIILHLSFSPVRAHKPDSLLQRVFTYAHDYANGVEDFKTNVYIKHLYQTNRRNFALWFVPSMYAIARGQRSFVSEQYSRLTFKGDGSFENKRQVYYTTIPHNRQTMPTLLEFITPRLYDETLYGDHILSPFNRYNHAFYHYSTDSIDSELDSITFRPRFVSNTQLVKGKAIVERKTGRIINTEMDGEYDMLHFHTKTEQGGGGSRALLPKFCQTNVDFKFVGNHISSEFEASYDCGITLPDTVNVRGSRQLIDSVRPYELTEKELEIYQRREGGRKEIAPDTTELPQITEKPRKRNHLRDISWEKVGESLTRSIRASNEDGYVRLSPIINPQYISYSHHKGISYRFKLGASYNLSSDVALGLNTRFGYNFKQHKFYFTLPFRLDYSYRGREAYAQLAWGSSNRVYNNAILEELKQFHSNIPDLENKQLDQFDDWNLYVTNNLPLNSRLSIDAGIVFHQRKAVNHEEMARLGMPTEYRSFAPVLSLKTRPWRKGPMFSIDYERALPSEENYLTYERWEADASLKHRLHRLQTLNLRFGAGFYTKRGKNYFLDYSNFRDENLPEGWDDDWSGNFQLLSAHLYNESNYYARGNVSFESPMLAASFLPFVGHYIERERIYLSSLSISHTRLYSELGYGFTCRYFSVGLFASFLNTQLQESGAKFTFELFRRW